jgi:signal peptidase II
MVTKRFLKKQGLLFAIITLAVVIVDQLTKFLIRHFQPKWDLIILKIQFIQNTGAGFGILQGKTVWLGILSLIVIGIIIYNYKKIPTDKLTQIAFALFLGGAIGNMIDRLLIKYVTDFINFKFWPAFNIADACLSIAVISIIILTIRKKE